MTRSQARAVACAATAVLVLAACGDDDASTSAATTAAQTAPVSEAPTTEAPPTTGAGHDDMADDDVAAGSDHHHGATVAWEGDEVPTVAVDVVADAREGLNVLADVAGYTFAPEHASTAHVPGEGHAHLYVDGVKVGRVYGPAYHLTGVEPGTHEITFELSANDHSTYVGADGEPIAATVVVEVAGDLATPTTATPTTAPATTAAQEAVGTTADHVIEATVVDGAVTTEATRREIELGDTVELRVTSDVADEVHVHGYDRFADVGPGEGVVIDLTADLAGVWEVELEDRGLLLVQLAVS